MKKELDEALCRKYPKIFRDRHASMKTTLMCWGFDVGNGWYNIINALCHNIQSYIDAKRAARAYALRYNRALTRALNGDIAALEKRYTLNGVISDWNRLRMQNDITNKKFRMVPEAPSQVVAVQVKEKFGGLRFYYDGGDEHISGMVTMAESWAASTCEVCGNPGKYRGKQWFYTACDEHTSEKDRE